MMQSTTELADRGVKAVAAGKYTEAIELLSKALKQRSAPLWLLERSKAYLRTNDLDNALRDAHMALHVAYERANRDQMTEAQIRRAVTFFRMGRYADADICAYWAIRLIEKAKASEKDDQQKKVDENGEYLVTLGDLKDDNKPDKMQGLATAMSGGAGDSGRSKDKTMKNLALSWRHKALAELEKLSAGHPGRKVTIVDKYPEPSDEVEQERTNVALDTDSGAGDTEKAGVQTLEEIWKQYLTTRATNTIRSNFYQTNATINIDFFVKNIRKDDFRITAENQTLTIDFGTTPSEEVKVYLWGAIKPTEVKHVIKSMKVEVVLQKANPGKWPALQRDEAEGFTKLAGAANTHPSFERFSTLLSNLGYTDPRGFPLPNFSDSQADWYKALLKILQRALDGSNASSAEAQSEMPKIPAPSSVQFIQETAQPKSDPKLPNTLAAEATPEATPAPTVSKADSAQTTGNAQSYPTSSKKGAVNWDKVVGGDDEEEESKGGDVNSFFQMLYKNADDDTRRAMMKSYIESNGTSLSTNWNEVKEKTFETQPPDGAEAKKWDE
ncbi:SGS-domain-containing protein [Hypomontagnella monticulosa]|nr:SGS-domain-containing protein [Hypomontagnella monticulosa]